MLLDFSNALASFQSYIKKIFTKKLNIFIMVYLDDISIYTKNSSQPYVEAI